MHVRLTCGYHVRHGGADYARQTTPHGGQTFDAPPTWDVAHHGGWMSYLKPSRAEASGEAATYHFQPGYFDRSGASSSLHEDFMALAEARTWCDDHAAAVVDPSGACGGFTVDHGAKLSQHALVFELFDTRSTAREGLR